MRRFPATIEAAAAAWDVPALAAGFSVAGEAAVTAAAGCEVATVFRVASVTKPLTATLALQLLDLEAPTGVWPDDVRVRHLLSHTSGYDGECGDLARFGDGRRCARPQSWPSCRACAGSWRSTRSGRMRTPATGSPATSRPTRAGSTYEDALAAHVLAPAGLESTSFGEPELAGTGAGVEPGPYPRARRPSGGLVSNVPDLLRFGRWHLAQPEAAQLRAPHGEPLGGVYGLGLFGERVGGVEVWGHARLLRRLPVVPARRSRPRGRVRRADEQRQRRAGAARARGRVLRAHPRRTTRPPGDRPPAGGGQRVVCRLLRERRRLLRGARRDATASSSASTAVDASGTADRRADLRDQRRRAASASCSTSRSRGSAASRAGLPSVSRAEAVGRSRPSRNGDRRRGDPRSRGQRRRRRGGGLVRLVRRGDADDRAARRRACDLLRRGERGTSATSTASSRCRPAGGRPWSRCPFNSEATSRALRDRGLVVRRARASGRARCVVARARSPPLGGRRRARASGRPRRGAHARRHMRHVSRCSSP